VDGSETIQALYEYDPYGRRTKPSGDRDTDFGFTGYFTHAQSALLLAPFRAFDPSLARWISQDPLGPTALDLNLYRYVRKYPSTEVDSTGERLRRHDLFRLVLKVGLSMPTKC